MVSIWVGNTEQRASRRERIRTSVAARQQAGLTRKLPYPETYQPHERSIKPRPNFYCINCERHTVNGRCEPIESAPMPAIRDAA